MEEKNKKIITLLMIFSVIFTIIGSSFAYFRWQTSIGQQTSVTFTVTSSFSCSADGGGNITSNDVSLAPTDCTNSQYAIKRVVTTNPVITAQDKTVYMDLWLDIETLDTGLKNSENFKWVFTKDGNSCDTDNAVSYGTFEGLTDEDIVMLLDSKSYETTTVDDTYYLYIWLDSAETSTSTQDQNFEFILNGECTDIEPEVPTTALTLIASANPTTLTYANATEEQKGNMWTFNQAETEQVPETTDYRFIGDSPNNWIKFNGEEDWRIIGVFDNKIKIIKNTKIGDIDYSFDYKQNGVGSSKSDNGSNDWTDSQLMYMLNTPIYKNSDGTYNTTLITQELLKSGYTISGNYIKDNKSTPNIIYELGKIPVLVDTKATSYSGTNITWQLNENSISQIEKTTFYLGGTSDASKSASALYNIERGITTINNNTNPTNWTGYVGLIYPSDYAYTYAYGVDDTCFDNTFSCTAELGENSWLYKDVIKSSYYPWIISPDSAHTNYVFSVSISNARVDRYYVRHTHGVHPSIYLKSNIELSGKGTQEEPYRIIE